MRAEDNARRFRELEAESAAAAARARDAVDAARAADAARIAALDAEVAQAACGGGAAAAAHEREGALASGSAAPAERADVVGAYAALLVRYNAVAAELTAQQRASDEACARLRTGLAAAEERAEALSSEVIELRAGKEAAEAAQAESAQKVRTLRAEVRAVKGARDRLLVDAGHNEARLAEVRV